MRSDTGFERLFKLWISVWSLVLEEKRHLETVTAFLQKIVFEKQGYPRFKNWTEICKLGQTNHMLMMAVASIDLTVNNNRVHQLISAFPQCFSNKEVNAPIPLSVIRESARQKAWDDEGAENGEDHPVSFDVVPAHIPVQGFKRLGRFSHPDKGDKILPESIDPKAEQGATVVWEGKNFVVLERVDDDSGAMTYIAPAECVQVGL